MSYFHHGREYADYEEYLDERLEYRRPEYYDDIPEEEEEIEESE